MSITAVRRAVTSARRRRAARVQYGAELGSVGMSKSAQGAMAPWVVNHPLVDGRAVWSRTDSSDDERTLQE